jgi:hypothetical protein
MDNISHDPVDFSCRMEGKAKQVSGRLAVFTQTYY